MSWRLSVALLAGGLLSAAAPRGAAAQSDPRLLAAVRQAQAGQVDSARATIRRLAAATPPTDSLYPEILYSVALTAADVTERERNLQRLAVEYPLSAWADDALLLLAQSDYAAGNLPGTARNLEKIRRDYPASPILPRAAVWAARTYFDMRNQRGACEWVLAGLRHRDADADTRAQLRTQAPRCGALIAASDTIPPPDTITVVAAPAAAQSVAAQNVPARPDTVRIPAAPAVDSAPRDTATKAATTAAAAASPRDTVRINAPAAPSPAPPTVPPAAAAGGYRVQLAAAATRGEADGIVRGLAGRGIQADVVEEKGYFKVRTGHFASRRDAQLEANRLRARLGNGAFVVSE